MSASPSPPYSTEKAADYDAEKTGATAAAHPIAVDRYAEGFGDLQVFKTSSSEELKLASDRKTVLIPQPSDDPDDPLNWSFGKKHLVLLSMVFASLLTDFGMTYGSVLFEAQAPTFDISVPAVAKSVSGGLFLQGPGGLLAVPLVQRYGRLPVLFWSQFLCAIMVMAAALSPNYACFTAFRSLQGFVNTAPQIVGLSFVHDMVNIWVFCLLGGPFLGPFVAAWLITAVDWRADYGVLAGLHCVSTLLVIVFGDETLYERGNPQPKERGLMGRAKLLLGITGLKAKGRPGFFTVAKDIARIQLSPQIFFITAVYVMVLVAWVIGVNITISQLVVPPPYSFSAVAEACSWIAPIIGAVLGEVWGHVFNDWLCTRYIRQHNGTYVLENRLWGTYAPTLVGFAGLVLYGQALQHTLHWAALLIAWACLAFSMVAATTAVSAYCLDSFPNHASLVASIINMWRTTGGFCVGYFQLKWIATSGAGVTFGCQAMVLGVAFLVGIVLTQVCGKK
ncbi:hypothetical protein LTR08_000736 [Meristemomyces frigidus]|nr:hypothetical protein LTR08_000736 [Meristemomyces frigidus]